ncbi:MAG: hypothetical protein ACFFB0_12830 [Promethearchaeota archaeon]
MDLDVYKDLFLNQKRDQTPITDIMGKITRGKTSKDFKTLTHDPTRKIVMLMGSDGLERILGNSGLETLVEIGYTQDHIHHLINQGFKFKLVIFNAVSSCLLATWDNTAKLASKVYPKAKKKIYNKLEELTQVSFEKIEKESSMIWGEIDKIGTSDPNFMTYKRFKQSKGTLIDVRKFFYFTLHFRELFSGDGFTYNQKGEKTLKEYICLNQKLKNFSDYRLIDIEISI